MYIRHITVAAIRWIGVIIDVLDNNGQIVISSKIMTQCVVIKLQKNASYGIFSQYRFC